MGGLTKEWFLLLIRQIFHPDYGMFVYHPNSRCYWFSTDQEGNLREYNLIGVLMGLAVYNSIILDLHFPSICYRKLLSPPVVPDVDTTDVGTVKTPTVDDLAEIMPVSIKCIMVYDQGTGQLGQRFLVQDWPHSVWISGTDFFVV
jgi:E3 ubiquitin-protein ligase HECTD2